VCLRDLELRPVADFPSTVPPRGASGAAGLTSTNDDRHPWQGGGSAFETVDWEFGAERDRLLREALQKSRQMRHRSRSRWRRVLGEVLNAGQGWLVFLVVGFFTGLIAGMIQVAREWAFDLKFGYCSVGGFWNSRKECCRISKDEDSCWQWRTWSETLQGLPGSGRRDQGYGLDYLAYIAIATSFGICAAWLVCVFAPFASGSGIPEIKTILGGFVMKGYLGGRVLLIKSVALVLSIASGMSVGLEAAYVHVACCVANVSSRFFPKYASSEVKKRELLSGAAAAGISVAFGAPVGGVLFSLEMLSSYFPPKTIWRSFYCAIVAAITLRGIDPLHSGKLVAFEITYHYAFGWFELPLFVMLGAVVGLIGTLMLKLIVRYAYFRHSTNIAAHPLYEVAAVAFVSAGLTYLSTFLRMDTTDLLAALYSDCKYETNATVDQICVESDASDIIVFLLICALIKFLLTILGTNTVVPGGHMVPSMAVGACIGRVFGFALSLVQERVGDSGYFAECAGHDPCVTPGVYAMIGSAAMLSAVSRMTVSLVVIIFELTDGPNPIVLNSFPRQSRSPRAASTSNEL
jgi:chloride channel 3/4/5